MPTNLPPTESEELDRDPFEELASEFSARFRRGERPSIEEYAAAYPDLAEEIRDLFPTIAAMEKNKARPSSAPAAFVKPISEGLPLQQLGDFRLLGEIGRGGMGIVYEAEQISLGRHVAVKVLPKQALLDERHLRRFEREAQTAAKLHHTNIVPVFGVGQQEGYHYIVMQFIPGVGLDEVLLALRRLVFQTPSTHVDLNSSGTHRESHANHNAQALLQGSFSDLRAEKLSSSFRRGETTTNPSTDPTIAGQNSKLRSSATGSTAKSNADSFATSELPATDLATKTIEFSTDDLDVQNGTSPSSSVLDGVEAERLSELGPEFYQSVARVGEQVASALSYAHEQGTLHRDIKPGNLLLDGNGTVWVADFGLAKLAEQDNVSRTGDIVGTLSYIPPESFSGPTDGRGDIYSLGLSLFELLTLQPAFFGQDRGKLVRDITEGNLPRLRKLNPNVPRDLETIVLKAVAHRPEDRYSTAADLANDLNCFLNDQPIQARRMSIPEQFARWYRRNKLVAALSAAVLSLLLALTVLFGVIGYQARQSAQLLTHEIEEKKAAVVVAQREKAIAQAERQKARDFADESVLSLKSFVDGFRLMRLPVSAGNALAESASVSSTSFATSDEMPEPESNPPDGPGLVAAPPINQEITARLEIWLDSLESLAEKAENYSDFAATFADLTLQVGILHKALGNTERAVEWLGRAIAGYERLVQQSNAPELTIGLAACHNEKAELLRGSGEEPESRQSFRQARTLLERLLDNHPAQTKASRRAQYELARTLFLMSIQEDADDRNRDRRGRRFGFMRDTEENLLRAIDLLQPLVESEANSEYSYLLARCYSALSSVAKQEDRKFYISQANFQLQRLVTANPGEDDYKFEFAIAKFRAASLNANLNDRRKLTSEAVVLLDQICGRNPDVFNYQIARARALEQHADILNRLALQHELAMLESTDDSRSMEEQIVGQMLRIDATEEAVRAADLFFQSEQRFGKPYLKRLPGDYVVGLSEVISKREASLAVEYFEKAIAALDASTEEREGKIRARAELGLAKSLIEQLEFSENYLEDFSQADRLLSNLQNEKYEQCMLNLGAFRPGKNEQFLDSFSLWAEATLVLGYLFKADLSEAQTAILKLRDDRLAAMRKSLPEDFFDRAVPIQRAQLGLALSNVYRRIGVAAGGEKEASQWQQQSRQELEALLESTGKSIKDYLQKDFAIQLLREVYFDQGDDVALAKLEDISNDMKSLIPKALRDWTRPPGPPGRRRRPPRPRDKSASE